MPYCLCCNQPCRVIAIDFGYGVTEAWGVRTNDVRIEQVSECCEADWCETDDESEMEDAA